jgi:hypothetical protein
LRCSKPKEKARPSFKELLAKYKRKGAARNQSNQQNGAMGVKHHQDMKVFITIKVILFVHNILLLDLLCHRLGIILAINHLLTHI